MFPLVSEDPNNMFEGDTFFEGIHCTGICLIILSIFLVSFSNFKQRHLVGDFNQKQNITKWCSQIRSFPHFFGGDLKTPIQKPKQPSKKGYETHQKKQWNNPILTSKVLNNKTDQNGEKRPAHPQAIQRRPRLMSLWFFPLLDQNLCHPHHSWHHPTTCSPKGAVTKSDDGLKIKDLRFTQGFGVFHKDISSLEFHQ